MTSHTYDPKYYYFTASSDGTRIDADARFHRAESVRDMLSQMQDCCADEVTGFVEGDFGDYWGKCPSEPGEEWFEQWSGKYGLPRDCFTLRAPGTHPGGDFWWVSVSIPIYVPVIKVEE